MIRDVVLDCSRLMAETSLQLFDLNQHTLAQWHNARTRRQEKEVLAQSVPAFSSSLVASEPLPPVLFKHPEPVRHGHPAYVFSIAVDASGQAVQRGTASSAAASAAVAMPAAAQHAQGQPPPVQVVFAVPNPAHLLQATNTAAIAVPAASVYVPPDPKVPKTTAWRRRKAAEAAAAQGAIPKKRQQTEQYRCQKCGQPKTKAFGHSQFRGVHFCAKASGKSVEQWMEEMKRGQK